jgi:5-methylcytosine-specific restriction endonuclease McrA
MNKKQWEEFRKKIIKRDKTCRGSDVFGARCIKEIVDIHHVVPKKKGGEDTEENCVGLCKRHHLIADNVYLKYGLTRIAKIWLEENKK